MMGSQINIRKRFTNLLRIVISVFGVASLYGCVSSSSLSRAFVDPATGWSSKTWGRSQCVVGPDVEFCVKVSNSVSNLKDETKNSIFGVSLYFEPKVDDLKFIPTETSLLLPGLPAIKPMRFDLQVTGNNSSADMSDCGHYNYPLVDFGLGPQYALRGGFCADLYFEVQPPSPDTEFVLRIPDIIRDNGRIRVPDLHFKKGVFEYWARPF